MKQKLKVWLPIGAAFIVCIIVVIYVFANTNRKEKDDEKDVFSGQTENTTEEDSNVQKNDIADMEVSDDIDEIVDSIIQISDDEADILGEEEGDTSYIDDDSQEINNLINSYDENKL